ncbi:hypothetical protein PQX77_004957 [Marasmius sp. AFHP31]|nr:hypothetical protein PQX77_004957 [Marasmius sp. AFHP31]
MRISSIAALLLPLAAATGGIAQGNLPVAPAPWLLDVSEGYVFVLPSILSSAFLPAGHADPLEEEMLRNSGVMVPDFGLLMIVRYASSPVGPYDELVYIPGRWAYQSGRNGLRLNRMYVDSDASVYNGRLNWNIPKHRANFNWTKQGLSTVVSISSPDSPNEPFFSAKLTPATGPIPAEVNTTLTGSYLTLVQPPLPGDSSDPALVGTDTWKSLLLNAQSEAVNPVAITGNLRGGRIGDGVGYPNVFPLLPIGVNLTGTLSFPVPEVFESV